MGSKTRKTFAILALIYLIIETQAFFFLSKLYSGHVPAELLSMYERFGYASSGIGITLFVIFQLFKGLNKPGRIVTVILTPLLYSIFVWGVYESINQSPKLIPMDERANATYSALKTLSSPSWSNLGLFFMIPDDKSDSLDLAKRVTERYPTPNRAVQSAYLTGIYGSKRFTEYYMYQAEMIDKDLWDLLWREAKAKAFWDPQIKTIKKEVFDDWFYVTSWLNSLRTNPAKWLEASTGVYYIYKEKNPIVSLIDSRWGDYINDGRFNLDSVSNLELGNIAMEKYAWVKFSAKLKGFPSYFYDGTPFFDRFRIAYSDYILSPYIDSDGLLIPWAGSQKKDETYIAAMQKLTPFLFDGENRALISFGNLTKDGVVASYSQTLTQGLPVKMRHSWDDYYVRTLSSLSQNSEEWENPVNYKLHSDMLRIGVITPILLIISAILILINLTSLRRVDYRLFLIGIVVFISVYGLSERIGLDTFLLDNLTKISVKESQIFLH